MVAYAEHEPSLLQARTINETLCLPKALTYLTLYPLCITLELLLGNLVSYALNKQPDRRLTQLLTGS